MPPRFSTLGHLAPAWLVMVLVLGLSVCASAAEQRAFSIKARDGAFWLSDPNGRPFFSRGVCCVNQGIPAKEFDPANPGYAGWRYYANSNVWANATLKRLREWGFTTIGGWSDFLALRECRDVEVAFAPVLHIGATAGAPWWDMWDPRVLQRMDEVARDPRVIGYFSDNEIGWWNAILFRSTLEQAPTSGQRQRLMELLRRTYNNDWSELIRDFEPAPDLRSWEELERHGVLFLRPEGRGIAVERSFLQIAAERYYSLVRELILKHDPRALVLGDRYPSFYYPEVARVAARYADAISINLKASWSDGHFTRFSLDTLHRLTGKPILVGEFYLAASENRSGNRNSHGTFPIVPTQQERATGFRNTLQSLARLPYVIGADWFQYYDEPTHGRFDGENFNFGLVDIMDRPYGALTRMAASLDMDALRRECPAPSDASQGVPPAPRNPLGQFEPNLALQQWDRETGFVRPTSPMPLADLYVCWTRQALYLGLYAQDVVEDDLYRGKTIPASDRAQWIISINGGGRIRARIGTGREPVVDHPLVRVVNSSDHVRNIAGMEIPARLFKQKRFQRGDTIDIEVVFTAHGRAHRVEWKERLTLRGTSSR
jgi:hypothetical protein